MELHLDLDGALHALVTQSREMRPLWEDAVKRLRVVRLSVDSESESAASTRRDAASASDSDAMNDMNALQQQHQLLQLASEQLHALEARTTRRLRHVAANGHLLDRLTDSRRLAWLHELHRRLDEIVATTRLQHADVVGHRWRREWAAIVDAMHAELRRELLQDTATWLEPLRASLAMQREALAMLRRAEEDERARQSTATDDDARLRAIPLLRLAFRKVLSLAGIAVPSPPAWELLPSELTIETQDALPGGHDVRVHRGVWGAGDLPVVVKQLSARVENAKRLARSLVQEGNNWRQLKHPNVLALVGGSNVSVPPFLVFEDPGRSMDDAVTETQSSPVALLLLQAARGLAYLHDTHEIVHGDLQLDHLYVDARGVVKIANLSSLYGVDSNQEEEDEDDDDPPHVREDVAEHTLRWRAPELLQDPSAAKTPATDVFAFGVCMWEALSECAVPWGSMTDASIRDRVLKGERLPRPAGASDGLWALLQSTWQPDPTARPTMAALVSVLEVLIVDILGHPQQQPQPQDRPVAVVAGHRSPQHRRPSRDDIDIDDLDSSRSTMLSSLVDDAPSDSLLQLHGLSASSASSSSSSSSYSVTLHQQSLGVRINSIGRHVVVSRFVRSVRGEQGELERSGRVRLGDVLREINGRSVAGMDRQRVRAVIQQTPRPVALTFERDPELLAESFQFSGLALRAPVLPPTIESESTGDRDHDRGIVPLGSSLEQLLTRHAFTVCAWFSLADEGDVVFGGVLLGAQDKNLACKDSDPAAASTTPSPQTYEQLLMVDARGDLSCSIASDEPSVRVQSDLVPHRWYHVAVSFDGEMLSVSVDGVLRHHAPATPSAKTWARLRFVTIGTGFTRRLGGSEGGAWYDFHGLVHELSVWRHPLTHTHVQQLVRGADDCVAPPAFSLRRDLGTTVARTTRSVLATRPRHVVAQTYG
ncbi:hypothetical protein PINS_up012423 [Pythium insidiosum]|nr:hypothetical protein PINS_up012423 [Pythium insidiosum]